MNEYGADIFDFYLYDRITVKQPFTKLRSDLNTSRSLRPSTWDGYFGLMEKVDHAERCVLYMIRSIHKQKQYYDLKNCTELHLLQQSSDWIEAIHVLDSFLNKLEKRVESHVRQKPIKIFD
jgi:hypothetical protein